MAGQKAPALSRHPLPAAPARPGGATVAMINIGRLIEAVQRNCHIADARHARDMTLCNYLLEMREFYRWEHGLPLDAVPPRQEVALWLTQREALWEAIAAEEFGAVPVAGERFDPFAAVAVNRAVAPLGLVYGAGIGSAGRAHFFLGRLASSENVDGLQVVISACEYARDLAAIPAALQGGTVIVRREALRQWLWEKAETWGVKQAPGPMRRALAAYGYFDDGPAALERMAAAEIATLILHERGEYAAGRLLGPAWEEMLAGFRQRRAELLARAVRDHLADCLVTLPALIGREAWGSLHFWFATLDGMRLVLFPRLAAAGEAWVATGDPAPIRAAVTAGAEHWRALAARLLALHRRKGSGADKEIAAMTQDTSAIAL